MANKRGELLDGNCLSSPISEGITAIICSLADNYNLGSEPTIVNPEVQQRYQAEALAIADTLKAANEKARVEVALDAKFDDIKQAVQDPKVSSMITIGHGVMTSLRLPERYNIFIDWDDVSFFSNHLKQGNLIQRHCGLLACRINVPLLAPVAADVKNVFAAVGREFDPAFLGDPAYPEPEQVFSDSDGLTYKNITTNLRKEPIKATAENPGIVAVVPGL